ncbi:cytochrome C [Aliarcobacter vitoriensis]|uniref:cytochrome C n=1 Tax=Aliarcobacter vitoriensis TaxID=2011099 RepID=UPI003AAD2A96
MKLLKVLVASSLLLGISTTSLFADAAKGQKAFIKFLKEPCGMDGAKFAVKHTQEEWRQIKSDGKFEDEIKRICPKYEIGSIKTNLLENIIDFSIEFAKDSGNVPSC